MATLELAQVSKVFDNGVEAVKSLDLFIRDGEFVVIVGPSGCGKTTVLRMVAGLEDPTSGTITLDGKVANDLTPGQRDTAMVFQNYALYPHLDVRQNIGFSLAVRKVPKAQRDQKVTEAAHLLGLGDLLDAKPRQLSGGQRQRVAMGRAIVREPSVFLMDEPLSNLDASLRVQMRTEVMHIQRRLGVATMYVTHDQTEAMTMGDRVAVMRGGVLQQFAAPQELYDRPANVFVASFMGSPAMNLFRACVEVDGSRVQVRFGSQRLVLDGSVPHHGALERMDGRDVVLGIRPEDLVYHDDPARGAADGCPINAQIDLLEALGNEQLVHFAVDAPNYRDEAALPVDDDAQDGVTTRIAGTAVGKGIARVGPRARLARGDHLSLVVDGDRLHFFDLETGEALNRNEAVHHSVKT